MLVNNNNKKRNMVVSLCCDYFKEVKYDCEEFKRRKETKKTNKKEN